MARTSNLNWAENLAGKLHTAIKESKRETQCLKKKETWMDSGEDEWRMNASSERPRINRGTVWVEHEKFWPLLRGPDMTEVYLFEFPSAASHSVGICSAKKRQITRTKEGKIFISGTRWSLLLRRKGCQLKPRMNSNRELEYNDKIARG